MLFLKVNEKKIWKEFKNLKKSEDWDDFAEKHFFRSQWIMSNVEQTTKNLKRRKKVVAGTIWQPTDIGYDIDHKIYALYQKFYGLLFEKLEPEAFAENQRHPERYGKICYYCVYWTRNNKKKFCDFCNQELFDFPLNEND